MFILVLGQPLGAGSKFERKKPGSKLYSLGKIRTAGRAMTTKKKQNGTILYRAPTGHPTRRPILVYIRLFHQ